MNSWIPFSRAQGNPFISGTNQKCLSLLESRIPSSKTEIIPQSTFKQAMGLIPRTRLRDPQVSYLEAVLAPFLEATVLALGPKISTED